MRRLISSDSVGSADRPSLAAVENALDGERTDIPDAHAIAALVRDQVSLTLVTPPDEEAGFERLRESIRGATHPRRAVAVTMPATMPAVSRRMMQTRWVPARSWTRIGTIMFGLGLIIAGVFARHSGTSVQNRSVRYATRAGEQETVRLADGSKIIMAPYSVLTVRTNTHTGGREVRLTGEAYFDVTSSAGRPFVVRTDNGEVRVLGTSFGVRHYSGDTETRIAVTSGKVFVVPTHVRLDRHTTGRSVSGLAVSGGTVAVATDSGVSAKPGIDPSQYTVWSAGRLVFSDAPVSQVLETVGRWCGCTFQLADSSLATQHVSAVLLTEQRTTLLTMLQDLLDVTMTFRDSTVTLHPRQGKRARPSGALLQHDNSLSSYSEVGR